VAEPVGDVRELVLTTLTSIARDKGASASARTAAARTLAEVLGMLKQAPKATSASAIEELSEGELDALIAARAIPGPGHLPAPPAVPDSSVISEAKPVAGKRIKRSRPKRAKL
jgi:hypothetical protein